MSAIGQQILDLRQNSRFVLLVDSGTSGNVVWSDIPTLDSGYTLTVTPETGSVETYTVGSGLTLNSSLSSVTWTFNNIGSGSIGDYNAVLVSDSKEIGTYLRIFFKIKVSA